MKHNRFGRARVLSAEELDILISLLPSGAHRTLAHLLRRTSARVSEGLKLRWEFISKDSILFSSKITKTKKSRPIPLHPVLKEQLAWWKLQQTEPFSNSDFVFKGRNPESHLSRQAFDLVLRQVSELMGLEGVSTHSFRRSCLTLLKDKKIDLRTIQSISGHASLDQLERYLSVSESDRIAAIQAL